jgi:hypothetical protein
MPHCNDCGYDSTDEDAEIAVYNFCNGNQITHCPDCMAIISTDDAAEKLGERF